MRTMILGAALLAASACKTETPIRPNDDDTVVVNPPDDVNPIQEDRILQASRPSVDILFVIDNSCSMLEEQAQLAVNFPLFMEYFLNSGLDYHIGVLSTDMNFGLDAGQLQTANGYRYIDENTENPEAVFSAMASMGTTGWWEERGRDAVYSSIELLRDQPANDGFYRGSAALDVIFVSDEDDTSTLITRSEFRQWMRNLKWADDMVAAHSIVGPDLGFGDTCELAYGAGYDYLELSNELGGLTFSICEPDWAPLLDELGLEASGLRREYFLSKIPVFESIEVKLVRGPVETIHEVCRAGEEELYPDCEVSYNSRRNSITFHELPDPSSQILITYGIKENYSADNVNDPPDGR